MSMGQVVEGWFNLACGRHSGQIRHEGEAFQGTHSLPNSQVKCRSAALALQAEAMIAACFHSTDSEAVISNPHHRVIEDDAHRARKHATMQSWQAAELTISKGSLPEREIWDI